MASNVAAIIERIESSVIESPVISRKRKPEEESSSESSKKAKMEDKDIERIVDKCTKNLEDKLGP